MLLCTCAHATGRYNAKVHPHLPKLHSLLGNLSKQSINPKVIIIQSPWTLDEPRSESWDHNWETWHDFVKKGADAKLGRTEEGEIEWARLGFNWPLWILFSSGTTGAFVFSCRYRSVDKLNDIVRSAQVSPSFVEYVAHDYLTRSAMLDLSSTAREACLFRARKSCPSVPTLTATMFSSTTPPRSPFPVLSLPLPKTDITTNLEDG